MGIGAVILPYKANVGRQSRLLNGQRELHFFPRLWLKKVLYISEISLGISLKMFPSGVLSIASQLVWAVNLL